jgi:hypothetical protein
LHEYYVFHRTLSEIYGIWQHLLLYSLDRFSSRPDISTALRPVVRAGNEPGLLIKKTNQVVFMKSAGTQLPLLTAACSGLKFQRLTTKSTSRSIKMDWSRSEDC